MIEKKHAEDELLSLSGIQHFHFCKRQWALIHIERQWEENLQTTEGRFLHERVDNPFLKECRGDVVLSRAFPLVSYQLGLYGMADVIEYIRSENGISLTGYEGLWKMRPVEYKRGKPKIDERDEVQLC
ncbi:MAG TPA: Dna2/Cas4 domain-containing protein, partial [Methanosarcina sp.]|nr:Dna2/Cas4 domain-containing protein [Methanosarcina sp.]